jgi:hypothetical protein
MSVLAGPDITTDSLIVHYDAATLTSVANINRNLFTSPEEITSAHPWYTTNSTVQNNAAIAPDGTMTADKVIGIFGITSRKSVYQYVTGLKAGETYTFSVYLKAAGFTTAMIWHDNNPYSQPSAYQGAQTLLNLTTGVSSNPTFGTMTPVGNDWYRCQTTAVYPYSGDYTYSISLGDANGSGTPVGNGIAGLLVWGVQLERTGSAVPLPAFEANFNIGTSNPLITYTRSTVGTFYNSSGLVATAAINTPRYDHDPVTFTNRGLLIEPAATNSIPNSTQSVNQFSDGIGGVTTNLATSNNPSSASAVSNSVRALAASSTANEIKYMLRAETWGSGQVNIFSAFFKQISANIMYPTLVIDFTSGPGIYARFDLTGNGTVVQGATTGPSGTYLGAGIERLPNGWYRCWVVGSITGGIGAGRASITIRNNTTTSNGYDPASTATAIGDGVFVWGPMIEKNVGDRRKPSSYYETTGSAATRSADSAVVTGGNFASWFNNTEGTILIEYYRTNEPTFGGFTWPMTISDGTNNNQISFYNISGGNAVTNVNYLASGASQLDYLQVNVNVGINKIAQSYKTNQVAFAANGSLVGVDYTNTTPTVNSLTIGNSYTGGNHLNDRVSRIVYWPVALTPAQVTAVTNLWSSLTTTASVTPTAYYPVGSNTLSNRLVDLSGNAAIGTVSGTYGYDATSYSVPVFTLNNSSTASNGQISLATQDLNQLAQTYNFTVFFAARKRIFGLLGNNNGTSQIFQGAVNGYTAGWRISENNQGPPGTPFSGRHNWSLGFNDISVSVSVSDTAGAGNRMCICAFTVTPTTLTAFVNGNFNTAVNPRTYVSGPSSPLISFTGAGAGSFNGDIGFFMIYNRALSQAEITQNFNALRGRYGI